MDEKNDAPEITHDLAEKIMDSSVKVDSQLDPNSKIMYRTLAELRKQKLKPLEYDWEKLAQRCVAEIEKAVKQGGSYDRVLVDLAAPVSAFTKMNRARLVPGDNRSPMGVLYKGNHWLARINAPYATAAFHAHEIFRYAVDHISVPSEPDQPEKVEDEPQTHT